MSDQRHIIKRQVIELDVRGSADAQQIQAELSRIYRRRIIPLIEQCCTELCPASQLYRIDALELDLGSLDLHNLEEDFSLKIGRMLRHELAGRINLHEQAGQPASRSPQAQSQLELLAVFIRTGSLPWWADASRPDLLKENLEVLLSAAPGALRRLLLELARENNSLRRMLNHYSDTELAGLCGLLVPAAQSSLAQVSQALATLLPKTGIGASQSAYKLRQMLWRNIFQVAAYAGQAYSKAESFYQAALKRLAIELGSTVQALAAGLQQAAHSDGADHGLLNEILQGLAPAPQTEPTRGVSEKIQAQPAPAKPQSDLRPASEKAPRAPIKTGQGSLSEAPETAQAETPLDLEFSDEDELYIGNAGLVILWPFLGSFFTHLGLLDEDRQFKDPAARQRAAGLLQVIAAQPGTFPEYLLPLNKLLCGLELNEVFDFGPPLSEMEAAECANLLEAVILQAPILRDMSPAGFRGTFLLRRGALSARDGAWLLRVERETYDIVLDQFPWNWEWVRLPWMEAPMRVEW